MASAECCASRQKKSSKNWAKRMAFEDDDRGRCCAGGSEYFESRFNAYSPLVNYLWVAAIFNGAFGVYGARGGGGGVA